MSAQRRSIAGGFVNGSAGAGVTIASCTGFSGVVHNGVGDYTLTLEPGVSNSQVAITATPGTPFPTGGVAGKNSGCQIERPTLTTIRVTTWSEAAGAAAAAELDFFIDVTAAYTVN